MTNNPNVRTIARTIIENPGITIRGITVLTGLPSRSVRAALPTLQSLGMLISEDDHGCLYPFDPYDTGCGCIIADLIAKCPSEEPGTKCPSAAPGIDRKDTSDD